MKKNKYLKFIFAACLIFIAGSVIKSTLISVSLVQGTSMQPNFDSWDFVLIQKWHKSVQLGDVIVFRPMIKNLQTQAPLLIKRIVAGPHSKIYVADSKVYINDSILEETIDYQVRWESNRFECRYSDQHHTNDDEYFVLGDNRCVAYDSRNFEGVPSSNIVGKVIFKIQLMSRLIALASNFKY